MKLCGALAALILLPALVSASVLDEFSLAALLDKEMRDREMPGLRAAVVLADGSVVRAAVGVADRKAGIPLDNDIGMPGGSTGKTFVAALTMLLVEEGVLSLDDPISKWLGGRDWFARLPNAEEIRVRHLLSHSAGLGDYPGRPSFLLSMIVRVLRHGSAYYEPEELIAFTLGKRPSFAPGEGYRYTDIGYLVLGRVIEAATGRGYFELLEERVLVPLGLDRVRAQDDAVLTDVAIGYTGGASVYRKDGRMKLDPRSEWTGGGLIVTPEMLARFYRSLARGELVSTESLTLMLESGYRKPGAEWHYGFGVFVHAPTRSFGHAGLWSGYRSHVAHYLDRELTVAVQTNRDGRVDLESVVVRIARATGGGEPAVP